MKKSTLFLGALLLSGGAFAQQSLRTLANERTVDEAPARLLSTDEVAKYYQGETVIWT